MKFTSVLKQIILEQSRFEILMDKYVKPKKKGEKTIPAKLKANELFMLIDADPTSRKSEVLENEATKVYKRYEQIKPNSDELNR